ncbi:MAG: Asp-tRNA(Asn)/Glu-tRNA(Gln) amidotransferase subunit GatA [Elusimicrobia bacterium]|nr:Asp-tRNA(Asn)/Glu-tRNA(Gln) amidotransferase subunit GatA [Elusimicrobiota bacterium]
MSALTELSARALADGVRKGEFTARAVADAHLARVAAVDPKVQAFLKVLGAEAMAAAEAVDAKRAAGKPLGSLAGVPVALKDNICLTGAQTSCASRILEGYAAPYDATVTERLKAADAVILGKTNMDEFAMGSSTENSAYFPTRNPWDLERVPGGSSGGSAAAVAAGMAPLALGSDTGGSIRQPGALCGIVGLKPTYGAVSRYGLVAFASSLDQIGPLARSADDAALALSVIGGHDPKDSTSLPGPARDYLAESAGDLKGLRLGLPREYLESGLEPDMRRALDASLDALKARGAVVRDVGMPHTRYALSVYYIIAPSEASSNLSRFDGVRFGPRKTGPGGSLLELYEESRGAGFGPEVKRRIMLGAYALSSGYYDAYYLKAQKVRTLIKADFDAAFGEVDLLVTPTTPGPAFRFGEKTDDPLQMYLSDVFTLPCNLAGVGGVSVPAGLSASGLPLGVQFMARSGEDHLLVRAARAVEEAGLFKGAPAL